MKRFLSFFLVLLLLSPQTLAFADNRKKTVYIASGSKSAYRYHAKSSCSALSRSIVESVTLEEAVKKGLSPCSKCRPPAPDFDVSVTPKPATGGWSSSSGSTMSTPRPTFRPSAKPTSKPVTPSAASKAMTPTGSVDSEATLYAGLGTAAASLVVFSIFRSVSKREKERYRKLEEKHRAEEAEKRRLQRLEEERKKREQQREKQRLEKERWEREREQYLKYQGVSPLQAACPPRGCFVGDDGLPHGPGDDEQWGKDYTVYMTASGTAYHRKDCSIARRYHASPVNVLSAKNGVRWYNGPHKYHPCSNCSPIIPDLSWFDRYQKIKKVKEKYNIR